MKNFLKSAFELGTALIALAAGAVFFLAVTVAALGAIGAALGFVLWVAIQVVGM